MAVTTAISKLYMNWSRQKIKLSTLLDLFLCIHTAVRRTNLTSVKHIFSMSETSRCFYMFDTVREEENQLGNEATRSIYIVSSCKICLGGLLREVLILM